MGIVGSQAPHSRRVAELFLTSMQAVNLNLNRIANSKVIPKEYVAGTSAYQQVRSSCNRHGCHLGQKIPQCAS